MTYPGLVAKRTQVRSAPKARRQHVVPALDSSVGAKLRKARERKKLTLRELARRVDLSPSLLSQIENGRIRPSVRALWMVVTELGISLDEVFDPTVPTEDPGDRSPAAPVAQAAASVQPPDDGRVLLPEQRPVVELESGVRWERLTARSDPDVEFIYAVYKAGSASSRADSLLRHNGREFGVVLSGRLGVTVGFDEYLLGPGQSITFDAATPHRLHNDGDEDATAIWVVLGRHRPPEDQAGSPT